MTSTEIQTVTGQAGPLALLGQPTAQADALARLEEWVTAASRASALVSPLVSSAFVPDAYKPRISPNADDAEKAAAWETARANATAAVLLGLSVGLDPLTSLQQIYLVHGRPGMYAKVKVALLQSRGFEIWTQQLTDDAATVCGIRPGEKRVHEVTVTIDDAKRAEWTKNEAYRKTPQDMLWSRAAGRLCDRMGANVLMGIASVEDIPDTVQVEATVSTPPRVTAADLIGNAQPSEINAAAPVEKPATVAATATTVDSDGQPIIDVGDAPAAATPQQRTDLSALLRATQRSGKSKAQAFIKEKIGVEVDSPAELTADEADQIIAALRAEVERNQADADPVEGQS